MKPFHIDTSLRRSWTKTTFVTWSIREPCAFVLRADPRYASARDEFHTFRIRQSAACDTTDQTACKLARSDADGAEAAMRSLLGEYRIDPRDTDALGLW
jgi:hypothetical protein